MVGASSKVPFRVNQSIDLLNNYLFIYCRVIKTARFHGDYALPKRGEVATVTLFTDRCGFSLPSPCLYE